MKRLFISLILLPWILSLNCCSGNKPKEDQQGEEAWYKNILIYSLEVATFKDSDGDGRGDFKGLTSKLGYLDSLGVDAVWLAPFMPSPGKDDGYDITDFYNVDPRLGTMGDFKTFVNEAHRRGIRVIMDIVLNHTSDEHPWFQKARTDTGSDYHLWYVWADKKPKDADKGMVFPGIQNTTWTRDSISGRYYFHRFYEFQPDLNYGNADVQRESFNILKFWLKAGADGYRLDAVPFIIDLPETGSDKPERMLNLVSKLRSEMRSVKPDALMLGEANLAPKENKDYFGEDNDGMQMMFNFYANQYLFYGLASGDTGPLAKALQDTKEKPGAAQWGYFLRNHDEIDLARLNKNQRNLIYAKFGPDSNMQLYDRGIRRRLAPMLNHPKQLRMAYSLLFSLPGTPVIRYGEEIGMGDDLSLKERLSVRTPMQWSDEKNGGFSSAQKTFRPVISLGEYSYHNINVADQQKDPQSLLRFIKKLAELRKACPEPGLGDFEIVETGSDHVLAIIYHYQGKSLLVIHNFAEKAEDISLKTSPGSGALTDLFTGKKEAAITDDTFHTVIDGYGHRWYRFN